MTETFGEKEKNPFSTFSLFVKFYPVRKNNDCDDDEDEDENKWF